MDTRLSGMLGEYDRTIADILRGTSDFSARLKSLNSLLDEASGTSAQGGIPPFPFLDPNKVYASSTAAKATAVKAAGPGMAIIPLILGEAANILAQGGSPAIQALGSAAARVGQGTAESDFLKRLQEDPAAQPPAFLNPEASQRARQTATSEREQSRLDTALGLQKQMAKLQAVETRFGILNAQERSQMDAAKLRLDALRDKVDIERAARLDVLDANVSIAQAANLNALTKVHLAQEEQLKKGKEGGVISAAQMKTIREDAALQTIKKFPDLQTAYTGTMARVLGSGGATLETMMDVIIEDPEAIQYFVDTSNQLLGTSAVLEAPTTGTDNSAKIQKAVGDVNTKISGLLLPYVRDGELDRNAVPIEVLREVKQLTEDRKRIQSLGD